MSLQYMPCAVVVAVDVGKDREKHRQRLSSKRKMFVHFLFLLRNYTELNTTTGNVQYETARLTTVDE